MKTRFKKLLSFALVLIMVITALPVSAMAEYGTEVAKSVPGIMDKVWEGWRDQWLGQLAGRISGRPAQKMQAEAVDGAFVKIDAPNLALPAGTEVRVVKLDDEGMDKVQAIIGNTPGVNVKAISAYDITFFCNGKEIEPNGSVSVDMSLLGIEEGKGVSIYHIDSKASDLDNGMTCEKVENVELNEGVASFKADSFSIYFVSNAETTGFLKVEFYDTNAKFLNAQAVKLSDFEVKGTPIYDPGIKILPNYDGTDFSGWAEVESENDTVSESDAMVIDEVNNLIKEHFVDYLADNVVKFKATNITLGYAKFYALNHNIVALKNIKLDNNTLEGTVNFNVEYKNPLTEYRTVGWVEDKYVKISGVDSGVMDNDVMDNDVMDNDVMDDGHIGPPEYLTDEEGYRVYTLDQIVTMSFDNESRMLEFYPYIESGFWLSFNNNESYTNTVNGFDGSSWNYTEGAEANDIAPVFCNDGITAGKQPTAPTREGYTFGGWYNDKACTEAFDWGVIDKETVVYAKWTPATAKFNITVWIEKVPENDFDGNFTKDPVYEYYTTMDYTGVGTAAVYSLERAAEDMLEIVNAENASNSGNTNIIEIYSPVDEHFFYLDRAKNNDFTAKVRGDGKSVINFYFRRHEITLNIRAVKNYTTLKSISTAEALTGAYKKRALYGKPAGSDYYEALTRVDGKIYLKKGLFMDSDNSNQQVMSPNAQEYTGDLYVINKDSSSQYTEFPNFLNTNFGKVDYYSVEPKYGDILLQFKGRYGQFFSYWPDYDLDSTFVYWSYNTGNNRYSPLGLNQFLDGNGYQGNVSDYVYDMIPYARAMYNSSSSAVIYAYQDFIDYEEEVDRPGHPGEKITVWGISDWYDMPFYSYLNTNEIQNVGGARAEDFNFDHLSYCWPYGSGNNATSVVENPVIEYNGTNWFQEAEENHNVQPNGPSIGATQYDYNCQLGDGNWKTNMEIFVVRTRNLHAMHYFIDGQEIKPFPGDRPLLYQEGNNDPITQRQSIYHNYSPNIMDYMMDIVVKGDDYSAALDAGDGSFDWDSAGMDEKLFFCNAEPQPNDIPADKHFVGWYKDYSLQEPFDFDERIQSDTAAYARLDPDHYRVVLHYDTVKKADSTFTYLDSSEPTTVVLDAGEQIFDNELSWQNGVWTDKDGKTYLFRGWFYDSKFQNPVSREATAISAFADMSYHIGSGVDACTNLSYEDVEEDYIAGKIDLYALFTEAKINVSGVQLRYDAVDGYGSFSNDAIIRMDEYVYVYGSEARIGSASTADDEDYAFDHWVLLDKEGNPTDYVYYPGDIFTITDQYAVSGVQITYNYKIGPLGDQTSITDFTTYGEIPTPPAAATRAYIAGGAYYEFDHWEPELAPATQITSYTAVYKAPAPIPHVNVYFHTNLDPDQTLAEDWEFADSNDMGEFNDVFLSVAIPADKLFIGWSFKQTGAEEADCITDLTIEENRDYDIYAVWANKVVFQPGTGYGEIVDVEAFSDTEYVIPKDTFGFYKPNWTFDGWKINGTGTTYYAGDKISNPTFPLVLVAQWLDGHNVIYHANNGTDATTSQFVSYGQSFNFKTASDSELSGFSRTGYHMTGKLFENAECTGTYYNFDASHASISADLHVYVQWEGDPYTVSYAAGSGASGNMQADSVRYGDTFTVPTYTFSHNDPDNYMFTGWSDGTNTYQVDDTFTITGNVTLTAQWDYRPYTINFSSNGGTGTMTAWHRDAGECTLPACTFNPPTGMMFDHWSSNSSGTDTITKVTLSESNSSVTVYAIWQPANLYKKYTGTTFDPNKTYAIGVMQGSQI
ncbi:MAG: InlB B-repeat-containing protein, partial [Clostridia bacterium]|nr:InlB B-repeat-containing protein [Clostridia bacterium]